MADVSGECLCVLTFAPQLLWTVCVSSRIFPSWLPPQHTEDPKWFPWYKRAGIQLCKYSLEMPDSHRFIYEGICRAEQVVKQKSVGNYFPFRPMSTSEPQWRHHVSMATAQAQTHTLISLSFLLFQFLRSLTTAFCDYDTGQSPAPKFLSQTQLSGALILRQWWLFLFC